MNLSPFLLFDGNCAEAMLKSVFDELAVDADPDLLDEVRDSPFGSYGHLADRYGVHWFFRGEPSSPTP